MGFSMYCEDGTSDLSLASVPISCLEGDGKMFIEYPLMLISVLGSLNVISFSQGYCGRSAVIPILLLRELRLREIALLLIDGGARIRM